MEYKLIDIKNWYKTNDQLIPEIQRDLVWSPKQIVMLWDSILRGFTIGSFIILQNEKGGLQVLDGQQRINAIAQGFGTYNVCPSKESCNLIEPDLVLWFDLGGTVQGTKLFPLMITTKSQPWGYNNDDDCSKLPSTDRRESLKLYFGNDYNCEDIYNHDVSLYQTWPAKAIAPLPLHIILNHISDKNENDFADNIIAEFENSPFTHREFDDNYINKLKGYYNIFRKLKDFSIGSPTISSTIFESERDDMEILFHRINRGGTNMSDDDLAYSTIKAHFDDTGIKNKDSCVSNYIAPAKLARLLFRIADSINRESFVSNFELKKIRVYSKNVEFVKRISDYYKNIKEIIQQVESIFNQCNVPKVLRVDIANKSTDLYMLLVYLAFYDKELKDDSKKQFICGLIFYLRWFCENATKAVNIIKKHIFDNDFSKIKFKRAISEIIGLDILTPIISPGRLKNDVVSRLAAEEKWSFPECSSKNIWNMVRENDSLLLYYQRVFINNVFSNYNPANSKIWDDNRPWDYDHIIPQNWFVKYSKSNPFAKFNKIWKDDIGNKAAIPFERNRSKSNKAEWDYYKDKKLLTEEAIKQLEQITPYGDKNFNSNKDYSNVFAQLTFNRFYSIYEDCYTHLLEKLVLTQDKELAEHIEKRKRLFLDIINCFYDCCCYYVTKGSTIEEKIITNEENITNWCRQWLSCGIVINDFHYVAVAIGIEDNQLVYEIGVRKAPDKLSADPKKSLNVFDKYTIYNEGWWYIERDLSEEDYNALNIKEEFKKLIDFVISHPQ